MKPQKLGVKLAALFVLLAGAALIFWFYWKTAGGTFPWTGHSYTVTALVGDPQDLLAHGDVDAAGVKVGAVSNISNVMTPEGTVAKVQIELDKAISPLYRNATVIIRQKTLVGENYLEIVNRGTPSSGALPDGGTLPLSADQQTVPLDKLLNSLSATTRAHIRANIRALGAGVSGRGADINSLLGQLDPAVSEGGQVMSVLDAQRQQVADLVQQAGTVLHAIANRQSSMQTLITAAQSTAAAVAARDNAFRAFLTQLPSTLQQARSSVAELSGFATTATPVIGDLSNAMRTLRPVINELGPTAVSTRNLLVDLQPLITVGDPLLTKLRGFSLASTPAIPKIDSMLFQIDPMLDYLEPYGHDMVGAFSAMGAATSFTPNGRLLHCSCPIGLESYDNWTPAERAAIQALVNTGALNAINLHDTTDNAYRKPDMLPNAGYLSTTFPIVSAYTQPLHATPGQAGNQRQHAGNKLHARPGS